MFYLLLFIYLFSFYFSDSDYGGGDGSFSETREKLLKEAKKEEASIIHQQFALRRGNANKIVEVGYHYNFDYFFFL